MVEPNPGTERDEKVMLRRAVGEALPFVDRFVGLMGRRSLALGEGMHILPCNSIHTFFMRIPIDVAFLDRDGVIVKQFSALPPWGATPVYFQADSVLDRVV